MTPQEQQLIDVICPAIQNKQLIRFWYLNATNGLRDWRTVEPHIIGQIPRKHIQLSAWFIPTPEQAMVGQKENWRTYTLRNISDVQVLDKFFINPRSDFQPSGYGMKDIFCCVSKETQPVMKINR
ncbi:MAG: WYL domain-containing protein [Bacteroidota bacterium]